MDLKQTHYFQLQFLTFIVFISYTLYVIRSGVPCLSYQHQSSLTTQWLGLDQCQQINQVTPLYTLYDTEKCPLNEQYQYMTAPFSSMESLIICGCMWKCINTGISEFLWVSVIMLSRLKAVCFRIRKHFLPQVILFLCLFMVCWEMLLVAHCVVLKDRIIHKFWIGKYVEINGLPNICLEGLSITAENVC